MNITANIISTLHLFFVIFVVSVPFITDNPFFLMYYCFVIFFVMVHWKLNNDTCVLTLIESKLRGKKDKDTFMGKLIKPIYNVSSREVQLTTLGLFLFAVLKIRLWDKRRTDYIYNLMYSKYRIFCQIYFPDTYIDSDGSVYTEQTEQEEQTEQTIIN